MLFHQNKIFNFFKIYYCNFEIFFYNYYRSSKYLSILGRSLMLQTKQTNYISGKEKRGKELNLFRSVNCGEKTYYRIAQYCQILW